MDIEPFLGKLEGPSTNNSKHIVRSLLNAFALKPSKRLENKLGAMGIGVSWSIHQGEDTTRPESFYGLAEMPDDDIGQLELGELLANE